MSLESDIIELKEEIERRKQERDKLSGRLESQQSELKKQFKMESIKDAEKYLKKIQSEIEKMKEDLELRMENFKEKYEIKD